jgi:hypothetical protein
MGQRLGKVIRADRIVNISETGEMDVWIDHIDEIIELFKDSSYDQIVLKNLLGVMESYKTSKTAIRNSLKGSFNYALVKHIGPSLGEYSGDTSKILQKLRSDMTDATDFVGASLLGYSDPTYETDNTGDGTLGTVSTDQTLLDNNLIVCECISEAANLGTFKVTSSQLGALGTATVGTAFSTLYANAAGNPCAGIQFTIADGAADWDIGDKIYIETWIAPDVTEANDGANQLSAQSFTRYNRAYSTNSGIVYIELTDAAGTRTVKMYSDAGKADQIAEGSLVGDGTIWCAPIGDNGMGLRVTVAYTGDDNDITYTFDADYSLWQYYIVNVLKKQIAMPTAGGGTQWPEAYCQ